MTKARVQKVEQSALLLGMFEKMAQLGLAYAKVADELGTDSLGADRLYSAMEIAERVLLMAEDEWMEFGLDEKEGTTGNE